MLFSKSLRTALGTASLLVSLIAADSAFAAAAPKAVVKKIQPTYSVTLTGSVYYGLRRVETGVNSNYYTDASIPGNNRALIVDLGTYGTTPASIGVLTDMNYGKLNIGSAFIISVEDLPTDYTNLQLAARSLGASAGYGGESLDFPHSAAVSVAEVHVAHAGLGAISFGLAPTMSAKASSVTYSRQGSELGVDYGTINYNESGTLRFVTPTMALPLQGGQGLLNAPVVRAGFRMPAMFEGLEMGVDYLPSSNVSESFAVNGRSLGAGMTYERAFDGGKLKLGASMASDVSFGSPQLRAHTSEDSAGVYDGLNSTSTERSETAYTRAGRAMGLSAAVQMQGFDFSLAWAKNNPYNDRAEIDVDDTPKVGSIQTNYASPMTVTVRAGYTAKLVAGSDTHFGVRYLDSHNVFQADGLSGSNMSHGTVWDVGITHLVGGAELYAGYTRFGDLELNSKFGIDDGDLNTGSTSDDVTLSGPSGVVAGFGYRF